MNYPSLPHNHGEIDSHKFVSSEISKIESFEKVADCFSQLADSSRLKIFWILCHRSECVIDIASMLEMSTPAISHHLKILKDSELIESCREGKEVFYKAADSKECRMLHQMIEKLMSIACPDFGGHENINTEIDFPKDQIEKIKKVHEYLTENLDKRLTIDELAKLFYINPTTLKTVFKSVYGVSIATHTNQHRMEKAAQLLSTTDESISNIARMVGYESQSKFSQSFKNHYQILPTDYRDKNKQ